MRARESIAESEVALKAEDEVDTTGHGLKDSLEGPFTDEAVSAGVPVVGDDLLDQGDGVSIAMAIRGGNLGGAPPPMCRSKRIDGR